MGHVGSTCLHVLWTLMSDSNIYLGRLKNPTKIRPGGLSWSIWPQDVLHQKQGGRVHWLCQCIYVCWRVVMLRVLNSSLHDAVSIEESTCISLWQRKECDAQLVLALTNHTKHCWSCVITPTSTDMQKMHVMQEENLTEQRLSFCMSCEKQSKRLVYAIYDQCGVEQFN